LGNVAEVALVRDRSFIVMIRNHKRLWGMSLATCIVICINQNIVVVRLHNRRAEALLLLPGYGNCTWHCHCIVVATIINKE
jgi:hypothetical protein